MHGWISALAVGSWWLIVGRARHPATAAYQLFTVGYLRRAAECDTIRDVFKGKVYTIRPSREKTT